MPEIEATAYGDQRYNGMPTIDATMINTRQDVLVKRI